MDTPQISLPARPLGFWLRAAERLVTQRVSDAFADEGVTRREWRALTVIAGRMPRPDLSMPGDRHPHHRGRRRGVDSLIARGWVIRGTDGPTLTEDGTAALDGLTAVVDGVRAGVAELVDVAQLQESLESLVRGLGWEEGQPLPRRSDRRGRRGHGHGHPERGRGHGRPEHRRGDPDRAHGDGRPERMHERGHDGGHGCRPHGPGAAHGRRHATTEAAFERGYTRGFEAGRIS